MSFGERNWHGIVRGQGYVRVLVGRARSDMLRVTQRLTQPKNFCTTRLPFQNRSFVDFTEKSEHLDVRWGRSSWKWPFSLSKTRCALMFFLYHPFTLWKCIIGRFYNSKRGLWGRSSWKWLFSLSKTHSGRMFFISFREIRFYLHKEFRVAEIWFLSTQRMSLRRMVQNQWYSQKFFAR